MNSFPQNAQSAKSKEQRLSLTSWRLALCIHLLSSILGLCAWYAPAYARLAHPSASVVNTPANPPLLLSLPNSTRAYAFENITDKTEPFSPTTAIAWSDDNRNRIWLYAMGLNLLPGDSLSSVTAEAQDGSFQSHLLTVEYIEPVPECPDVTRVLVRLPDELGDVGDVLASISLNGLRSNRVRVAIGHFGGGPPDDPTSGYSITGQVVDNNGNALSGITINLKYSSGELITTTGSGTGGLFYFNNLSPGISFIVCPTSTATLSFTPQTFANVNANQSAIFIAQPKLYKISGRVVSSDGIGLTNAVVTCNDGVSSANAISDLNGNYSFTSVTPNRNIVLTAALVGFTILNPTVSIPSVNSDYTQVNFIAASPTPTPTPSPLPTPTGPTFYVAPNGSPNGNGSINNPWDLQTALNQPPPVLPGSTIYLRGGTYIGKFTSRLLGTASAPIVVRSYPDEWAKLDGYVRTTLAAALPNTPGDPVTVVINPNPALNDPSTVWVGNEIIYLSRPSKDGATWTNCVRGYGGTSVAAHSVGDEARNDDNILTVKGSYALYRDFEILSSYPTRVYNYYLGGGIPSATRGQGVNIVDPVLGVKLINLIIHDAREGIYTNAPSDVEVYGCIIYNNGFADWDRGHGMGLYQQNDPTGPQKKIRNVISFNNFADGMKAYAESQYAQNFLYEHVISFNNGVLESFPGNQSNNGQTLSPNSRTSNIFVGVGNSTHATNDIRIQSCYLYEPFDAEPSPGNLAIGYAANVLGATGLQVTDSRIMGGRNVFSFGRFRNGSITGNKFFGQHSGAPSSTIASIVSASVVTNASVAVDSNSYYDQLPKYSGVSYPLRFEIDGKFAQACDAGTVLKYSDPGCMPKGGWKQVSGFDTSSGYFTSAPTGIETFVIPNEYEAGRAHIAIYNWALAPTVNVDLSNVLSNGDHYAIYAVENYFAAPVATGTYNGSPIAVPMTGSNVAAPIGLGWTPATVRPQFGAFVVRKQ
jgi:hypothetical protein